MSARVYKPIEERILFKSISEPLVKYLAKKNFTPIFFNFLGLFLTLVSGLFFVSDISGKWYFASFFLYFSFLCDKIDGDLARELGIASRFGRFFDGFIDRVGEIILVLAVSYATNVEQLFVPILAISGPLLFYFYQAGSELYLNYGIQSSVPAKPFIFAYNRARHVLIYIFFSIIGYPIISLYALGLINVYAILLFMRRMYFCFKEKRHLYGDDDYIK